MLLQRTFHQPRPLASHARSAQFPRPNVLKSRQLSSIGCIRPDQKRSLIIRASEKEESSAEFLRKEQANKEWLLLSSEIETTAKAVNEALGGTSVYLIGMMGSGKSLVGKLLAQALSYRFLDSDEVIEEFTEQTIAEIFEEDGEEEFRQVETAVLQEIAAYRDCVVATGGGSVTRSENWGHFQGAVSVWLDGPPSLLAQRVVADGVKNRPLLKIEEGGVMAEYERTLEKIATLLDERRTLYADADIHVPLVGEDGPETSAPAAVVVLRILKALDERIKRDAIYREEKKNFRVVNNQLPPSMREITSINPPADDPYLP